MLLHPDTTSRLWPLAALYDDELKKLPGVRVAKWLAFLVSGIAVVLMVARKATPGGSVLVAVEALAWLSWLVAGLATLSAVRHWSSVQQLLAQLAGFRGIPLSTRELAVPLALVFRLTVLVGSPALLLACGAVALSQDATRALPQVTLLIAMPLYAVLLALGLSGLSQALTKLTTVSRTSWLLAVIVGPHLLRELWPATPSLIYVYDWLLQQLTRLGAAW